MIQSEPSAPPMFILQITYLACIRTTHNLTLLSSFQTKLGVFLVIISGAFDPNPFFVFF